MNLDRRARAVLAALLFTFFGTLNAYSAVDRAICSASDSGGVTCTAAQLKSNANEEINAVDARAAMVLGTVSGTNTILGSVTPTLLTLTDGNSFYLKPANTITGAATLNINSIGAKTLASAAGAALSSGDLQSSTIYLIKYYATADEFRVLTNLGTGTASASNAYVTIGNTGSLSAERALTAGTGMGLTDGGANSTATLNITDAELACILAQTSAADKISYWTGSGTCALADLPSAIRTWFSSLTSANLAAAITNETGSGLAVFNDTPTLVTPVLGVATATTINKVTITAPASAATLTIPDGVTLTGPAASGTAMTLGNTETVTGVKTFGSAGAVGRLKVAGTTSGTTVIDATATASGTLTLPAATDTLVGKATTDTLTNKTYDTAGTGNSFSINGVAATANTGTGAVARAAGPTFTTPTLGAATATTVNKVTITAPASAATLTLTDGTTVTGPATTDTLVGRATTDTLTNKTLTTPTITTPVINGASTGTGVASAATASTLVLRDANANSSSNAYIPGYTTTATAAGTTTLTVASTELQFFTGVTTQTVTLPVTSTMVLGQRFTIVNNSSGAVTVNSSGSNLVLTVASGNTGVFTVILTSGTSAASWSSTYISSGAGTGTVTSVGTGTGLTGGAITTTGTAAFDFSDAGASFALNADECRFTSNATVAGYLICEGDTADTIETRIAITDPTASDKTFTIPNADSNAVQPLTCTGADFVSAISSAGVVTCSHRTESLCFAASDETTALTTGNDKVTFHMPYALTLTSVSASLNTVSSSGLPTFDVQEDTNGETAGGKATIFSTKVTIDANELRSSTAAAASVLSDTALAANSIISVNQDVAGTGAKGAKLCLIGYQ